MIDRHAQRQWRSKRWYYRRADYGSPQVEPLKEPQLSTLRSAARGEPGNDSPEKSCQLHSAPLSQMGHHHNDCTKGYPARRYSGDCQLTDVWPIPWAQWDLHMPDVASYL